MSDATILAKLLVALMETADAIEDDFATIEGDAAAVRSALVQRLIDYGEVVDNILYEKRTGDA